MPSSPRTIRRIYADDFWTLHNKTIGGGAVPPQCVDIERSVVGAMIISDEARAIATEVIGEIEKDTTPFYNKANSTIYKAICEMENKDLAVDLLTLTDYLRKKSWLEFIGGPAYIVELTSSVVTTAYIKDHCRLILEKSLLRKLVEAGDWTKKKALEAEDDAFQILSDVEGEIFNLSQVRHKKGINGIGQLTYDSIDRLAAIEEKVKKHGSFATGITSGLKDLDAITTGWQKTDLIILAARPSVGKSALSLSFALKAALNSNEALRVPVAFFSLEMGAEQLSLRLLCSCANVDAQKARKGQLSNDEWKRISMAIEDFSEAPIYIDDTPGITPLELRSKCRNLKARHNIGLVIVDYLQLMEAGQKFETREREISHISRSLKGLAKELDIPVIALSQLNRNLESRADKRPMMSDAREGGSIENDCDLMLFVYRPEVYGIDQYDDGKPTHNTAEIIVGKQRNGPIGSTRVGFFASTGRWEDLLFMPEFEQPVG